MNPQRVLLCLLFLILATITGQAAQQEPAPVADQCRAEVAAWEKADPAYWHRFAQPELSRRFQEMYECTKVDRLNEGRYTYVALLLEVQRADRFMVFLIRHKLWDQFVAEDAKGVGR